MPPNNKIVPIFKSTFCLLRYVINPARDDPAMWFASLPTATAGGIPPIIKIGVVKKPPPTPNIPDNIPAMNPIVSKKKTFWDISAMGK